MNSAKKMLLLLTLMLVPSVALASPRNCPLDRGWERGWHDNGWRGGSWRNDGWNGGRFGGYPQPTGWHNSRFDNRSSWAIENGFRSGELSRSEARELSYREQQLRANEARYARDGFLSAGERRALEEERRDFYHDLKHNLNDGERRW